MKAKVIQIGSVENGNPINWSFDSYTQIPALSASGDGILYYGHTANELEQMQKSSNQIPFISREPGEREIAGN